MATTITNTSLFNPIQISGCALWLDAADSASVIQTAGSVTAWNDKSGNGRNATPFATGPQYIQNSQNSLPGLSFTGSNTLRCGAFLTATNFSCFIVANKNSGNTIGFGVWKVQFGSFVTMLDSTTNRIALGVNNSATYSPSAFVNTSDLGRTCLYGLTLNSSTTPGSAFTFNGTFNGTNTLISGTSTSGNANTCAQQVSVGGLIENGSPLYQMTGFIYEVIVYSSDLTTDQRQQVESYLAWKWNLQASLPTTHPYYYNPILPNLVLQTRLLNVNTSVATFNPTSIAGCALWLDAADSATVIQTGSSVSAWNDKSGNGRNMIQNASFQRPIYSANSLNGNNSILFFRNASNSFTILENTSFNFVTPSWTYFTVLRRNAANTTYQRFLSMASVINGADNTGSSTLNLNSYNANNLFAMERGGTALFGAFNTSNVCLLENIVNGSAANIDSFNANTNYLFTNGSPLESAGGLGVGTNLNIVHVRYGSATFRAAINDANLETLEANIGEVILFNRTLRQSELQQVESYLAWKWNIQASLPTTHPYYYNPILPNLVLQSQLLNISKTVSFQPNQISGLSLWLDATETSRMTIVGSNITQYIDKSSNQIVLSNATVANQPTLVLDSNNIPNILFNGTSQTLVNTSIAASNLSLNNEVSIFFVHSPSGNNGSIVCWTNAGGDPRINFHTPEGPTGFKFDYSQAGVTGRLEAVVSNYLTSGRRMEGGYKRGTTQVLRAYGLDLATRTNSLTLTGSTSLQLTFGAFFSTGIFYGGRFCELVWFNRGLNNSEIAQVEGYLAWKWGLQKSLPTSHPYSLFPPN